MMSKAKWVREFREHLERRMEYHITRLSARHQDARIEALGVEWFLKVMGLAESGQVKELKKLGGQIIQTIFLERDTATERTFEVCVDGHLFNIFDTPRSIALAYRNATRAL
jgi:hypothetical protein